MRGGHESEDSAIRLIWLAKMQFGWIIGQALPYQCLRVIFSEDGGTPTQLDAGVKTAVIHDWLQDNCEARGHSPHMLTLTKLGDQARASANGSATDRRKRRPQTPSRQNPNFSSHTG
jgi:hypothetical protein